jgi:TatD DNase family protein
MIDTHCHLDQYSNPVEVGRAAERAGIGVIAMTSLPSHYVAGAKHARALRRVRLALGLHPLLAEVHEVELDVFEAQLPNTAYVGEVGLDFSHEGRATRDIQVRCFTKVLGHVQGQSKFLSLHSRGAEDETLEMLKAFGIRHAVFHWFTGRVETAKEIEANGYYFSVNPAMLRSQSGRRLVGAISSERILTESDGPYVRIGDRPAIPQDIHSVVEGLASVWNVSGDTAHDRVRRNCRAALAHLRERGEHSYSH